MNSKRSTRKSEGNSPNIDLKFIPRALIENCEHLVESYHGIHGYGCLPDILWRAGVREFVEIHDNLWNLFRKASNTRSARKVNSSYVVIASALLSLEVLANDFMGWGTRFPGAKRRAASLLAEHLPPVRERLREVYLHQRNYVRMPVAAAPALSSPPEMPPAYPQGDPALHRSEADVSPRSAAAPVR
jgi:hypothetical protein